MKRKNTCAVIQRTHYCQRKSYNVDGCYTKEPDIKLNVYLQEIVVENSIV